jgi:hypothetical protein
MWEQVKPVLGGTIVVGLEQATRELCQVPESSGQLAAPAALSGEASQWPAVALVSAGLLDLKKFYELGSAVSA